MLYDQLTQPQISREWPLSVTATDVEEGVPLVYAQENGQGVAKIPAGANTEIFLGVSRYARINPATTVVVETVQFGVGSNSYTLDYAPLAASTSVLLKSNTDGVALTYTGGAPAAGANTFNVGGTGGLVLTIDPNRAGQSFEIVFSRNLSVTEADTLFGRAVISANAADLLGSLGVIEDGIVYTDKFATGDDWSTFDGTKTLKVAANGFFTIATGATGATVRGEVVAIPTTDQPFLGLRFSRH